jgi:hypothetical protein
VSRTKTKVDSSNKDISQIQKEFLEQSKTKSLEETISKLNETVDKLLKSIEEKDSEILALQRRLNGEGSSLVRPLAVPLPDEELISNSQLERLKHAAMNRELSLEEVKKFDLLVKNKRLAQGETTTIVADYKNLPANLQKTELIKIASKKVSEDGSGV